MDFQEKNGLTVDGKAGSLTQEKLGVSDGSGRPDRAPVVQNTQKEVAIAQGSGELPKDLVRSKSDVTKELTRNNEKASGLLDNEYNNALAKTEKYRRFSVGMAEIFEDSINDGMLAG